MSKVFIGTSGWNYNHWRNGVFYPQGLASSKWLEYYARHFNSVELNVTFYRLVRKETFKSWYQQTPKNFYFVAKGSRFITHIKRIKSVAEPLNVFWANARHLNEKLLSILWQFAPGFKKDLQRLEIFLKLLEEINVRQSFEFRHPTWFDEDVYQLLKKYNACLCVAHSERFPCVKVTTADFMYLRFHGADAALYSGNYPDGQLKEWAEYAKQLKRKNILAFFNNDAQGFAVKNAVTFRQLLTKKRGGS